MGWGKVQKGGDFRGKRRKSPCGLADAKEEEW